jgi:RNA recognition motif-containing protein
MFQKAASKGGIGIEAVDSKPAAEIKSVYVSNLPQDITEEELNILFSPLGKLRKIKIYLDSEGKQKGDALITFLNSDPVIYACAKVSYSLL